MKRFTIRNWFRQIWRLESPDLQSELEAWRHRRADSAGEAWRHTADEFLLARRGWSFCSIQALNWLDEANPHCGGQGALLRFHWSNILIWSNISKVTYKIKHHKNLSNFRGSGSKCNFFLHLSISPLPPRPAAPLPPTEFLKKSFKHSHRRFHHSWYVSSKLASPICSAFVIYTR